MKLHELDFYHPKAKHYFECHITLDPVLDEGRKALLETISNGYSFHLAKLFMQKGTLSEKDAFITAHSTGMDEMIVKLTGVLEALQEYKFPVRRVKIEDVLFDTKLMDTVQ